MKKLCVVLCALLVPAQVLASGFGVFTQGASGLGQANAVVAHPTGPSSLYFNPALLNDVPGRQFEVGTTAAYGDREIELDSTGDTEESNNDWNFPSTLYYTHEINDKITGGLGVFFPFGLSSEWDQNYEGRYLGYYADMFSMAINPAVSWRVTDRLHLAAGFDLVYIDTDLRAMINQAMVGLSVPPFLGGPIVEDLPDVRQKLTGDGWGLGFNLGTLFKVTDRVAIGAAYRSEVEIDFDDAEVDYAGVDPRLSLLFLDTDADVEMTLPAQFVAGAAFQATDELIIEIGCRWEDWESTNSLEADLDIPFLGQGKLSIPRDWKSTWAYNVGGQYMLTPSVALNAGYLYGENPVPSSTFEPIIPDSDVHLFTVGADLRFHQWTVSGAFGYQYHEGRSKQNALGDPVGSLAAGMPVNTANGDYETDIYLVGLSVGYAF